MSDGGRTRKPPAAGLPLPGEISDSPAKVFRSLKPGEIGAARMNPVHEERAQAAAQIQRTLKAWRAGSGKPGAATIPKGTGAPLNTETRARMEPKLGADLSAVRVHTSGESAEAAHDMGARAFTVGADVHFNSGEFAPGSKEGDKLLAHELTHVVQGQKSGIQRKAENGGGDNQEGKGAAEVSEPGEPAEQEADAAAEEVAGELHGDHGAEDDKDAKTGAKSGESGEGKEQSAGEASASPEAASEDGAKEKAPPIAAKLAANVEPGTVHLARPTAAPAAAAGTAPAAGAPGAKLNLQAECQKDPVAKQKYLDVQNESAPAAAGKKAAFFKAAEDALNATPGTKALDAMRSVVRGGSYFFLGPEIPDADVLAGGGVSRLLDLPGLYKYDYIKPSVKARFLDEDKFVAGAAKGAFDPNAHMDERKSMRGSGGVKETWWFPSGEANAVDLDDLRKALYIQDNPNYAKGAVRFDLDPSELKDLDFKLHKPTAFDGMMQGWGSDPWWVTKPGPWGITKNNTHEAVMQSQQFRFFKKRSLIMPTAAPGPGGAGAAAPAGGAAPPRGGSRP